MQDTARISIHFLQIGSGVRGSIVARPPGSDAELYDVGFVDGESIEVPAPVFIPPQQDDAWVPLWMHHWHQYSCFVAVATGSCVVGPV
jgi:hypothetical protein